MFLSTDDEGPWPFLRQILSVDNWTTCCCEISKLICRTTWILLFSNLFFVLELLYWPILCLLSRKCTIGKIYIDIYVSIQNSIPLLIDNRMVTKAAATYDLSSLCCRALKGLMCKKNLKDGKNNTQTSLKKCSRVAPVSASYWSQIIRDLGFFFPLHIM